MHVPFFYTTFITSPFSQLFITPHLEHFCIFHADYLKVFRLNAFITNVVKGDKIKRYCVFYFKKNKRTSGEQSSDVIFNLYAYNLFPHIHCSSFTVNPNTPKRLILTPLITLLSWAFKWKNLEVNLHEKYRGVSKGCMIKECDKGCVIKGV